MLTRKQLLGTALGLLVLLGMLNFKVLVSVLAFVLGVLVILAIIITIIATLIHGSIALWQQCLKMLGLTQI